MAEARHPLVAETKEHGYGAFSARYGNIYAVRQLRELLDQALGLRKPICEFAKREDGRYVDMLRPRAVPLGFASIDHALADRNYHLRRVQAMIREMDVFVFTLGLTEAWENTQGSYCYPMVPGVVAGEFSPDRHRFVNYMVAEVVADLSRVVDLISGMNSKARILFTVSPVGLVATYEHRNVMVSTSASKSILRAAVEEVVRRAPVADYFPSYEIITGPYARGRYWAPGCREVTDRGVEVVMESFIRSRMPTLAQRTGEQSTPDLATQEELDRKLRRAFDAECDEVLLDPSLRPLR
jgi:hypothetical protein